MGKGKAVGKGSRRGKGSARPASPRPGSRGATPIVEVAIDGDGIATLTWTDPALPVNVLSERALAAFGRAVEEAAAEPRVKGIVVASGKETFHAGADLNLLARLKAPADAFAAISEVHRLFRRLETCGKPVAAAINGSALGGGYELALACHRRVAADSPDSRIGLPEVGLGLFPGGGGTQRLPRLVGLAAALPLILEGRTLPPREAKEAGLVDEVVAKGELLRRAKRWLRREGENRQPWDEKGFRLPGFAVQSGEGMALFSVANAKLREKTRGNHPGALAALASVYNGCQIAFDAGMRQEARHFAALFGLPSTRHVVRTNFFAMNRARKLAARPAGIPPATFTRVGVIGAGFMGSAIAHVTARAGLPVVLLDVSRAAAEKGRAHAERELARDVERGRIGRREAAAVLRRLKATDSYADLTGADLVVEAVFEDLELKREVIRKAAAHLPDTALFASNTSTLPITTLAESFPRPASFVGLHFFSPVERMRLVEVIVGKKTAEAALAHALDFVGLLKKTPIVVNDAHGFYTSRVVATFVGEGVRMLAEGITPALIEHAAENAGMPVGPLALADEIGIDVMHRIQEQARQAAGGRLPRGPYDDVAELFAVRLKRLGRKSGAGFYDYPKDKGRKRLWPELSRHFPPASAEPSAAEVERRLLHLQAVEAARCLAENVVRSPEDADVGSILGWGFAPFTGGVISYIDGIGVGRFVAECRALARKHGPRFRPPKRLLDMARRGEAFHPG